METTKIPVFLVLMFLVQCTSRESVQLPPLAEVNPVETDYFGMKITDPYRYMENPQDSSVVKWIGEQSDYARTTLNSIPGRQDLIDRMIELDKTKSGQVSWLRITDNDRYFYVQTMPEDQTGRLFFRDGFEGAEVMLFDPLKFIDDTSNIYLLTNISPSLDGSKVFFVLFPENRTGANIFITLDVGTRELLERYDRNWMSIASWLPDNNSYLFNLPAESGLPEGTPYFFDSRICLHKIGVGSARDKVIFSRVKYPELSIKPEDIPNAFYDNNSRYIFCSLLSTDRRNHIFYLPLADLDEDRSDWRLLFKREDEVYNFIATDKDIYFRTPKQAPNFKILKIPLVDPDLAKAETIVKEDSLASLTSFRVTKEGIYYTLLRYGVHNELYQLLYGEKESVQIDLPAIASSLSISSKGHEFSELWLDIQSWTGQPLRYLYLPYNKEFRPENIVATKGHDVFKDFVVESIMIPSHDNVKVPLTMIYRGDIKRNGKNYVLLFGYGAYGYLASQVFDPNLLFWADKGGILAIAHVRGGGEFGDNWHRAGMKTSKPNTWKDLIACTEYLISDKFTSSRRIAMTSSSAGGILVGRAMTERPDLFAASMIQVGFLNPLRLDIMQNSLYQQYEFGNVKDSVEFRALYEMDPYLHLEEVTDYPATLVISGALDQMVPLWMSAKFAARLQSASSSKNPVLYWVDPEAGHITDTRQQQFEILADVLCFAFWQTGHPDFQIE